MIHTPVIFLSGGIQGDERDEASDLHEKVEKESHARVECEGLDGGHGAEGAKEEAGGLGDRGEEHGGPNFAQDPTDMLGQCL